MSIPSLKKETIVSFACLSDEKDLGNNKLVLVTTAGVITGTLAKSENFLSKAVDHIIDQYRQDNGLDEKPLNGNDGLLSLEDVTIMSGSKTFNIPFLTVFYDQIIGVSIGNIDW